MCAVVRLNLIVAVIPYRPIHDIQGEFFIYGAYHSITLLGTVNKFPLIGWTDVQFPIITDYSIILIVHIPLNELSNGYFFKVNFHSFFVL